MKLVRSYGRLCFDAAGRIRHRRTEGGHFRRKAVSMPGNGCDRLRAQHLPESGDVDLKGVLLDNHRAPNPLQQLVLGDQKAAAFGQGDQDVERIAPIGIGAPAASRRRSSGCSSSVQTGSAPLSPSRIIATTSSA